MPAEAGVVPAGRKGGCGGQRRRGPSRPPVQTPCQPGTHKGVLSHLSRTFTSTSRCSSRYLVGGRPESGQNGQGRGGEARNVLLRCAAEGAPGRAGQREEAFEAQRGQQGRTGDREHQVWQGILGCGCGGQAREGTAVGLRASCTRGRWWGPGFSQSPGAAGTAGGSAGGGSGGAAPAAGGTERWTGRRGQI